MTNSEVTQVTYVRNTDLGAGDEQQSWACLCVTGDSGREASCESVGLDASTN